MTVSPNVADPTNVPYRQITYNADNMPLRIDVPVSEASGESCAVSAPPPECFETIEFVYDGDMRRAKKVTPNGSTYYIGAHYEIINGIPTKYIFAGNLRIAQITAAGLQYFHKDHLHSSTAVSDGFGETVETTEYFPFGFECSHSGIRASNYKYTDQELDLSTGLYNYDARLYDPVIAIFISADSLLPDTYDPQQLNRFSYARNNPLKYIDPDGHAPILSKSYIDPISGELINEPPQRLRTFDLKIGKSFRFRFNPLTFGLSTIAGRIPGFGLPAGITGSKTGAAVKASKSLVRSKLPDLPKILTRAFEGPVR